MPPRPPWAYSQPGPRNGDLVVSRDGHKKKPTWGWKINFRRYVAYIFGKMDCMETGVNLVSPMMKIHSETITIHMLARPS